MLSFEDYINLLSELADAKITTNKDKFFSVLNQAKENAKEADKKVLASLPNNIYLPVKYKKEKFANVITACIDDYSLAMQDMKDPEKFAAILSILNDKLAKDGDVYDISTPETLMLGLANRYANNARECQYARQWKLFAFYMRSLAYFIPQLIHKANLEEEQVLTKIEAKLKLIANDGECPICHCDPCECDDYGDDVSPSGLTAKTQPGLPQDMITGKEISAVTIPSRVKKLLEEASREEDIPVLYLKTQKGKEEIIVSYDPKFKDYNIIRYENGKSNANSGADNLPELYQQFKKYYNKSARKRWGQPQLFLDWSNSKFVDIKKLELDASTITSYVEMQDKDIKDLKKWVKDHHYDVKAFEKFTKDELKKAWDLMLEHNKDQRDLEEWFMFLVG